MNKQSDEQTEIHTYNRYTNKQTHKQTDIQTDRQLITLYSKIKPLTHRPVKLIISSPLITVTVTV